MFQLNLDEDEVQLLKDLVETCLSDLRVEIHSTDSLPYKEILKKRKEILAKLLAAITAEQELETQR